MNYRTELLAAIQRLPSHPQHNFDCLRIMMAAELDHPVAFARHRQRFARALGELDIRLSLYEVIGWNINQATKNQTVLD